MSSIISTVLEQAALPFKLISEGLDALAKVVKAFDDHRRQQIWKALQPLYFTPFGAKSYLSRIARGDSVAEDDEYRAYRGFRDQESEVAEALQQLSEIAPFRDAMISMVNHADIQAIKYGKQTIREYIEALFQQTNDTTKARIAVELLKAIDEINKKIEALEPMLNSRIKQNK